MKKITLVLADDHTVVRQGLRLVLEEQPDMRVVGEADNGRHAVQLAKKLSPEVVVLDMVMPLLNGIEATRQIAREVPAAKVLILSSYNDEEYVRRLIELGAAGYLIKQSAGKDLLTAIREVHKGNAFFSPSISKRLLSQSRENRLSGRSRDKGANRLTPREAEVLRLIAEGQGNKQIAAELSISIKTVEKHRQQVMNKLHIHDVAGLTRHAISKGVVPA